MKCFTNNILQIYFCPANQRVIKKAQAYQWNNGMFPFSLTHSHGWGPAGLSPLLSKTMSITRSTRLQDKHRCSVLKWWQAFIYICWVGANSTIKRPSLIPLFYKAMRMAYQPHQRWQSSGFCSNPDLLGQWKQSQWHKWLQLAKQQWLELQS